MERFHQVGDRVRFAVTRTLLRVMLSRMAGCPARDWRFRVTSHGRPELDLDAPARPPLRFNVSHTQGLVACAVTLGREVGVDVEHAGHRLMLDVAERFFAPSEVADLRALPAETQGTAFFDYWTLKESYIKARGLGLSIPLEQFSFRLRGEHAPTISFAPELQDDPDTWLFVQDRPTPSHRLALAVRVLEAQRPRVLFERVPPEALAA
jgi:4'-phosphopantetheinyl transferase